MNARRGAAALMAAAAVAAPASASSGPRGVAGPAKAGIARAWMLPMAPTIRMKPNDGYSEGGWTMGGSYDPDMNTLYWSGGKSRSDRFALAHELAHAFDDQVLTDPERARFQRIMRAPKGPWVKDGMGGIGWRSPDEWFADYYASAALGLDGTGYTVHQFADLGPKRMRRFRRAIDEIGRSRGLKPFSFPQ